MPLRRGRSSAVVSSNVRELIHAGRPQRQAVAIALKNAGLSRKGKNMAKKKRKSTKRKASGWSKATLAAYKREKRALINKYKKRHK